MPPSSIQELRTLTRTRKQLVREEGAARPADPKTLEDANLKIASVVADIMGVSGRAILDALVAGETDPEKLVDLTRGPEGQPRHTDRGAARTRHAASPSRRPKRLVRKLTELGCEVEVKNAAY